MPVTTFTADDLNRLRVAVACRRGGGHRPLDDVVADDATPGGVIVCGTLHGQREVLTSGLIAPELGNVAPTEGTVYDVASLTKVLATWPLAGQAVEAGLLDLDAPVRDVTLRGSSVLPLTLGLRLTAVSSSARRSRSTAARSAWAPSSLYAGPTRSLCITPRQAEHSGHSTTELP
ncbi:hypothetical protein CP981_06610 [Streptomyces platensis]|uniref:Beta-lactamase n=1 Tax=Streptomyces platensis TaxID=58346 RepID=A0AAE6NEU6_STRPT|nr:serine hydrolase [Streptomyces platensis]OSY45823.1 Beta-lactamase [Streptomyces platensis]QEV51372.1 hypothetical protein CP981_06610 [Streptomyces platensis]